MEYEKNWQGFAQFEIANFYVTNLTAYDIINLI